MKPTLRLHNLSKEFLPGKPVLDKISLDVFQGEWISIVGKSGAGKSTLLSLLAGLISPSSGEFDVEGRISFVPQRETLLPWRTALENALLPLEFEGRPIDTHVLQEATELFSTFNLLNALHLFPKELSGGMAQRASIIRALLQRNEIMLMDEPFSAIDFDARLKLGRHLREVLKASGRTAVLVTHNFEEAISLSDRIIILSDAKLIRDISIHLDERLRDPVSVRQWDGFAETFATIWKEVGGEQ